MKTDLERKCIVTGRSGSTADLIRFVLSPDGQIVPDLAGRLPGRGFWLSAKRDVVETATKRKAFNKAVRGAVVVPDDLPERLDAMLVRRGLDTLGLARRAGQAVAGFEKVSVWLREGKAAYGLIAVDAGPDGREKIGRAAGAVPLIAVFTGDELGAAFGRDRTVHVAVAPGRLADALAAEARRIALYRGAGDDERQSSPDGADDHRSGPWVGEGNGTI